MIRVARSPLVKAIVLFLIFAALESLFALMLGAPPSLEDVYHMMAFYAVFLVYHHTDEGKHP